MEETLNKIEFDQLTKELGILNQAILTTLQRIIDNKGGITTLAQLENTRDRKIKYMRDKLC